MTLVAQRANLASQVRVGIQIPEVHTTLIAQKVGPDADREGRHTNLGSAQRVGLGAEGRTCKPHVKEGRLVRKKQVHTNPGKQSAGRGAKTRALQPCDTEGSPGEPKLKCTPAPQSRGWD